MVFKIEPSDTGSELLDIESTFDIEKRVPRSEALDQKLIFDIENSVDYKPHGKKLTFDK